MYSFTLFLKRSVLDSYRTGLNVFISSNVLDKFLTSFISAIEPIFIVIIGVLVGFIVISIMQPLFSMNSLVQ